jgi:hypothetical protein
MHEGVNAIRVKRARDTLARVIIGFLFFCPPQFAGVDEWADVVFIPQLL